MPVDNKRVEELVRHSDYLWGLNSNWRSYWQDVADFVLPRKAWMTTMKYRGDRLQYNFLYDSEAIHDLQIMAAGFHTNLTTGRWFGAQAKNIDLMDNYNVRLWFAKVERAMYSALQDSNFETSMQEFYVDAGAFGTGVVYTEQDDHARMNFTVIPLDQVSVEEDSFGNVTQVYRNFKYTAYQAYGLWKEKAGKNVSEAMERTPYKQFDFIHYVGPRWFMNSGSKRSVDMPFESLWINKDMKHLITEGGYEDLPYHVGRFWKSSNDPFGYGPAMNALADTKLINAQKKTSLRRGMKEADSAWAAPNAGYVLPLNFNPSAINYYDPSVTNQDALRALHPEGQFSITAEIISMTKDAIRRDFFVDLFQALGQVTKEMTAQEVQHRIAENMGLLGPAVGRFSKDVLGPVLTRTFNVLFRKSMAMGFAQGSPFPPVPSELLADPNWEPVFLGPLARAQKQSELTSINTYLQTVGGMAQFDPTVIDNVNFDKAQDVIAKVLSVTPELQKDASEVQKVREQRAKLQQAQMQMAALGQGAEIAKTGAEASHKAAQAGAVAK